jgi:allantoate deiminase
MWPNPPGWRVPPEVAGKVDGERLWSRLHDLSGIGASEGGGVTRLSFTDEERAAKDLVAGWMEEAGLQYAKTRRGT